MKERDSCPHSICLCFVSSCGRADYLWPPERLGKFLDSSDTCRGLIWLGAVLSVHASAYNSTAEGTVTDGGTQDSIETQDRLGSDEMPKTLAEGNAFYAFLPNSLILKLLIEMESSKHFQ